MDQKFLYSLYRISLYLVLSQDRKPTPQHVLEGVAGGLDNTFQYNETANLFLVKLQFSLKGINCINLTDTQTIVKKQ